jgi:ABC-type multidrug transport system ATPase subunit
MDEQWAIESDDLGKRFGARWAVRDLALRVEPGSIYGFLGRNGAGKTSTIRLMLGLLRPDAGGVRIFGDDVAADRIAAARHIGSLIDARATYDQLTGRENLDGARRLLRLPAGEIDRVLELVDLRDSADRKVGHYSLGMRQRLGLARALLGGPRLLILDEPMNGLDPAGIRDMRTIIRQMPERVGAAVFLSSHLLSEVEQIVTHVGLMHHGRLARQGAIGALLADGAARIDLQANDPVAAAQALAAMDYAVATTGQGLRITLKRGTDGEIGAINRDLVGAGIDVVALARSRRSLEDMFEEVEALDREAA